MATHKRKKRICKRTQKQLRANQKAKTESQQSPIISLKDIQKDSLYLKIPEKALLKLLQLETNFEWMDEQPQYEQLIKEAIGKEGTKESDMEGENEVLWADLFMKIVSNQRHQMLEELMFQHLDLKWNFIIEECFKHQFSKILDEEIKRIIVSRILELASGMFKETGAILLKPGKARYTCFAKTPLNLCNINLIFCIELDEPTPRYGEDIVYLGQTFNQLLNFYAINTNEKELKAKLHEWLVTNSAPQNKLKMSMDYNITQDPFSSCCAIENNNFIPLVSNYFESVNEKHGNDQNFNTLTSLTFTASAKNNKIIERENEWFLEEMRKFKHFQFNISSTEEDVIRKAGSAFVIGRSGTGKTLCAILKLFSEEILYLKALKEENKTGVISNPQFANLTKSNSKFKVHTIFLTASPCLSNELYHSYTGMKAAFKGYKATQIANAKSLDELPTNTSDAMKSRDSIASGINKNKKPKKVLDDLRLIQSKEYPLFLTVKKFLILIDSTLCYQYFMREEGKVVSVSSTDIFELLNPEKDMYIYDYTKGKKVILAKEVNYGIFYNEFWVEEGRTSVDSAVVWKEILSYIKGSPISHLRENLCLGREEYIRQSEQRISNLNVEERSMIYEHFINYEKWKQITEKYDIMDVANHILSQIESMKYSGPPIHFLICDEVQDLLPAILYLAMILTERNILCAGDTAQTIAEGVNFRFQDLRSMFFELLPGKELPPLIPLTENFRSHQQILDLANSVLELLEYYFPLSIVVLQKEKSRYGGHKPIITKASQEAIRNILEKMDFKREKGGKSNSASEENNLIFGANQVVIVKDYASKATLPPILKSACCLTVLEAKGLEFEHVILYNIFSGSIFKDEYEVLKHREGNANKNILLKMGNFRPHKQDVQGYFHLCSELKQLYTAITRAKRLIIICDDFLGHTRLLYNYWVANNLVTDILLPSDDQIIDYSMSQYIDMGDKLMEKKNYKEAFQLFIRGNDPLKSKKAEAYYFMEEGILNRSKGNDKESKRLLSTAASSFQYLNDLTMAGRCYFIASEFENAIKVYKQIKDYNHIAECYSNIPTDDALISGINYYILGKSYRMALKLCEKRGKYILMMKTARIIEDQGYDIIAKEGKWDVINYFKKEMKKGIESNKGSKIKGTKKLGFQELPYIKSLASFRLVKVNVNSQLENIAANFQLAVQLGYGKQRHLKDNEEFLHSAQREIIKAYKCYSFGYLLETDPQFLRDCFIGNAHRISTKSLFWLNTRRWLVYNSNDLDTQTKLDQRLCENIAKFDIQFTKWNLNFLFRSNIHVEKHVHTLEYNNFLDKKAIRYLFLTGYWKHILHLGNLIDILDICVSFRQYEYGFELISSYEAAYSLSDKKVQEMASSDYELILKKKHILNIYYAMHLYTTLFGNAIFQASQWRTGAWYVQEIVQHQDPSSPTKLKLSFLKHTKLRMKRGIKIFSQLRESNYTYQLAENESIELGIFLRICERIIHFYKLSDSALWVARKLIRKYLLEILTIINLMNSLADQLFGDKLNLTTILYNLWDISPLYGIFNVFNGEYLLVLQQSKFYTDLMEYESEKHKMKKVLELMKSRHNLRRFRNIRQTKEKKTIMDQVIQDYYLNETNIFSILIIDNEDKHILAPTFKIQELIKNSMLNNTENLLEFFIRMNKFSTIYRVNVFENVLNREIVTKKFSKYIKDYIRIHSIFEANKIKRNSLLDYYKYQEIIPKDLNSFFDCGENDPSISYQLRKLQLLAITKLFAIAMVYWNLNCNFQNEKFKKYLIDEAWYIFNNTTDFSLRIGSICFILLIQRDFPVDNYYRTAYINIMYFQLFMLVNLRERNICDALYYYQQHNILQSIDSLRELITDFPPTSTPKLKETIKKMLMEKLCALSVLISYQEIPNKEITKLMRHYPNIHPNFPQFHSIIYIIQTSNVFLSMMKNNIPTEYKNLENDFLLQLISILYQRSKSFRNNSIPDNSNNMNQYLDSIVDLNSKIFNKFLSKSINNEQNSPNNSQKSPKIEEKEENSQELAKIDKKNENLQNARENTGKISQESANIEEKIEIGKVNQLANIEKSAEKEKGKAEEVKEEKNNELKNEDKKEEFKQEVITTSIVEEKINEKAIGVASEWNKDIDISQSTKIAQTSTKTRIIKFKIPENNSNLNEEKTKLRAEAKPKFNQSKIIKIARKKNVPMHLERIFYKIENKLEVQNTNLIVSNIDIKKREAISPNILQLPKLSFPSEISEDELYYNKCPEKLKQLLRRRQKIISNLFKLGYGKLDYFLDSLDILDKLCSYLPPEIYPQVNEFILENGEYHSITNETNLFMKKMNKIKSSINITIEPEESILLNKYIESHK